MKLWRTLPLIVGLVSLARADQVALHEPSDEASLLSQATSDELLYIHRTLIEIESITGNEEKVGKWLESYLKEKDFTVELQEVSSKRYNLLAYGKKRETTILVTSHIDTVPPFWPYYHNKTTDLIGGRGSVDAKASVAAQIMAVRGLKDQLQDDLSLLFVVGEETGGDGMRAFSEMEDRPEYDIVIFGEPTESKLVCGHKGMLGFSLKATGKAAHSGYPWLGVSANDVLVEALESMLVLRKRLPWSEKYGNTTMNFGKVEGGVAANVVAEAAEANMSVRIAAATPQIIKSMIVGALEGVKSKAQELGGDLEIEWVSEGYAPVDIDCDVEGFETVTVNYGTDVPNLKGNHKKYLYGPGSIFVAHSDHEALKKKDLEQAVLDFRRLIIATSMMHHDEREET
ncbi:acetylornithine deacetylase-like protein [Lindgomyces ingoldianus]|uniref:Acetylornithine deacetylase-like protein n=1 Tax=Lindgomyces ingoldianus TaxID=673940 RepID=A0ACB6R834_9PLEO|nr:acetylornithine deacetylase-like protein [Lindgomyces ingoldianus]KAF2474687.1 acetylornithine deacetylase-like protein [Lindgomyces ingoldianus]